VVALEAECARLRDELAGTRLQAAATLAAERRHGRAEALREAAHELTLRVETTRTRTEAWQTGVRDAVDALRARAAIEEAASPAPPRAAATPRAPRPRQHL
jgi:phage-related tail fiber protein